MKRHPAIQSLSASMAAVNKKRRLFKRLSSTTWGLVTAAIVSLVAWWLLYRSLAWLAHWYTYTVLHFPSPSLAPAWGACCLPGGVYDPDLTLRARAGQGVEFFLFQASHALMLLVLAVFGMGIVRSFFSAEKVRRSLMKRNPWVGCVLGSLLGVVTPFCSCSAVPLFVGFLTAGVPLGATFSFITAAPLVNELALALLWSLFGWKAAALYALTGVLIALVAGWFIQQLRMEQFVEEWVRLQQNKLPIGSDFPVKWGERIHAGVVAVQEIAGRVWPYLIMGVLLGSLMEVFVPPAAVAAILGPRHVWSIPLAVILGVPIYSNAVGVMPIAQALLDKGVSIGTVMAFIMAVVGLSLPEFIVLRKVLKTRLIVIFFCTVSVGIVLMGYLFNAVF